MKDLLILFELAVLVGAIEFVVEGKMTIDVDNVEALEAAGVLGFDVTTLVLVTC